MEGDQEKWGLRVTHDQVQDDMGFIKPGDCWEERGCFLGLSRPGCAPGAPHSPYPAQVRTSMWPWTPRRCPVPRFYLKISGIPLSL